MTYWSSIASAFRTHKREVFAPAAERLLAGGKIIWAVAFVTAASLTE